MRLGVVIALLFITAAASTAQEPTQKVITQPDVEVRSGPSFNYYATSILRQGEVVEVIAESTADPGWLAIKPPRGSFSLDSMPPWLHAPRNSRPLALSRAKPRRR